MQVGPQRRLFLCFIEQTVTEICTFQMGEFPVQISLSVIWTWSSPKVIYKINKFYIRITVYLDDFLILGKILEETILSMDTVIYLLQKLAFVINLKKSALHPIQRMEFLGMFIDSVEKMVSLPQEGRVNFQKVSGYIVNTGQGHWGDWEAGGRFKSRPFLYRKCEHGVRV